MRTDREVIGEQPERVKEKVDRRGQYLLVKLLPVLNFLVLNFLGKLRSVGVNRHSHLNFKAPQFLAHFYLTHQDLTHKDLTHKDLTDRDLMHRDLVDRDLTDRDLMHRDLVDRDLMHRDLVDRALGFNLISQRSRLLLTTRNQTIRKLRMFHPNRLLIPIHLR